MGEVGGPEGAAGVGELRDGLRPHGRGEARRGGCRVVTLPDDHRVEEVVVQMVDVFDDPVVGGAGERHEVEHRQVLDEFAQADPARVRADRHAELGREEQDGEVLVDAGDAGGVDLQDVDGAGLEELFEDDTVLDVFAGGDLDGATASRTAAWPRTSSGLVGSSIQ